MDISDLLTQQTQAKQALNEGQLDVAMQLYSHLLDDIPAAQDDPALQNLRAEVLLARGDLFRQCLLPKAAIADYEQWMTEQPPSTQHVEVLNKICGQYNTIGDYPKAAQTLEEALRLLKTFPDPVQEGRVHVGFGVTFTRSGRLVEATEHILQGLAQFQTLKNEERIANAYNNLGLVYQRRGIIDQSIAAYEEGLKIYRERGDVFDTAVILSNLGECYQNLFDMTQALNYHQQSLNLLSQTNKNSNEYPQFSADLYRNIGVDMRYLGRVAEGLEHLKRAWNLCVNYNAPVDVKLQVLLSRARTELEAGELETAEKTAQEAQTMAQEVKSRNHLAKAYYVIGLCHQAQGKTSAAEAAWQQAIFLAHETDQKSLLWQIHAALATALADPGTAAVHRQIALDIIEQLAEPIQNETLRQGFLQSDPVLAIRQHTNK